MLFTVFAPFVLFVVFVILVLLVVFILFMELVGEETLVLFILIFVALVVFEVVVLEEVAKYCTTMLSTTGPSLLPVDELYPEKHKVFMIIFATGKLWVWWTKIPEACDPVCTSKIVTLFHFTVKLEVHYQL